MSVFRELLAIFRSRFTDGDALAPGSGFDTNIYQAVGLLAVPGLFVSIYLIPRFMALSFYKPGPAVDWELRADRLFFVAFSFTVVGFATMFEWDMLFPDRRDFLILTPFPIRLRDLFAAKLSALGLFLLALFAAANFFSVLLLPVFSVYVRQARAAGVLRLTLAQITATAAAAAFAFLLVAGFQGVLVNMVTPRFFRRISPWLQAFGMAGMVLSILLFPIYSMAMRPIAESHPEWLRLFPPYWFAGLYEWMLPRPAGEFVELGAFGLKALAAALATFGIAWAAGFRRHYRRTLESDDTEPRAAARGAGLFARALLRSPAERGIFHFTGRTLARSAKHRLFLATYWSAGLAFGLLVLVVFRAGKPDISPDGLRSFPLLLAFFVISGFRSAFQFPAELNANWLFQLTEAGWGEVSRAATRKRVVVSGLLPVLLLAMPIENAAWGASVGVFQIAFQFAAGALLTEVLFRTFDKVPFTCNYFPGAHRMAILAGLYLIGFTNYSFQMADLELSLERTPARAALFFAGAGLALAALWRPAKPAPIRFDAGESEIQTLDLS